MKGRLTPIVVLGVVLSGCYLFAPADTASIAGITVDPSYLTVGPGEQVTVNVTTDPPDAAGTVTWKVDDDYYAAVYGTNKVGLITGKHLGATTLTATLGEKSTQVLCNVVPSGDAGSGIYITSSETVILMAPGDSRSISAQLVGGSDQDQNGIQWQVKDTSVLDIIGQGPNALITALKPAMTQITLTHPMASATFAIAVKVDGSTKALQLSKNSFLMNPADIQELEASIVGGTTSDIASIQWSVRAATGTDSSFLTLVGNGERVSLMANSAGQGTVFAVFGTQVAQCDVIVQSNKKMAFQTGIVSGNPGNTFTIGYDYSPATMSITWMMSDASIAGYSDNRAAKQVTVTLIKEGTATLRGTLADGMTSDSLSITSRWERSLTLSQTSINGAPSDEATTVSFDVSPPGATVSVSSDDTSVATVSVNNSSHTITVTPHQEGQANISAWTPDVNATISCNYSYTSLSANVSATFSSGQSGRRSGQLPNGTLVIANRGGSITLTASPSQSGATGIAYTWNYQGENDNGKLSYGTVSDNMYTFNYSAGWSLIGGYRTAGTLYLVVTHNGTQILSKSWPIIITWD